MTLKLTQFNVLVTFRFSLAASGSNPTDQSRIGSDSVRATGGRALAD